MTNSRIHRLKPMQQYEEGPQHLRNLGRKSCCRNNWRLPGEPRSLGDYTLSNRMFNHNASNEFFQPYGFPDQQKCVS